MSDRAIHASANLGQNAKEFYGSFHLSFEAREKENIQVAFQWNLLRKFTFNTQFKTALQNLAFHVSAREKFNSYGLGKEVEEIKSMNDIVSAFFHNLKGNM